MIAITTMAMIRPVIGRPPPCGFALGLPRPERGDARPLPRSTACSGAARDPSGRRLPGADHARQLLALALRRDPHDVPDEPEALHRADEPRRRVERRLEPREAMAGRARERVVVVVPGLAEARQREPPHVRRVVLDGEAAPAEEVADRVDRPRNVVEEEDPHEA